MSQLKLIVEEGQLPESQGEMKELVDRELDLFNKWWAEQPGHGDPMHALERLMVGTYIVQKLQGRIA